LKGLNLCFYRERQQGANFRLVENRVPQADVLYQVYDVTSSLTSGQNCIAAILGDGWYGSSLTWASARLFPAPNRLVAQLEIDYSDGSHETLGTDEYWKAAPSPILHSEIYAGEVYDARAE